ncbi:MAG: hypothetical protein M1453_07635 [Acidobacteria bacterium]|nr:hypothetical protein [Acidobacteriota bacterium]MCL5287846.1 hypothetical protein [Acidobacteriota bacterium]
MRRPALTILTLLLLSLPLHAQNRPLRTVDAETVPPGTVRVQVGFDFLQDVDFPLSGLSGDLTSVGIVQIRMGVGKIAEVQLEGAVHHFLDVKKQVGAFVTPVLTGPNSTHDVGDFSIATKIRLLSETKRRPALGFRFGYQMPNSNQSRGIGSNTSNIFAEFIVQKHFGKLNLMGNAGVAILQAPAANFTQNDVLTFGAGFSYAAHRRVNVVGEVAGFHSTRTISPSLVGTESRSQGRFGLQIMAGGFQWDVAGIAGITRNSPRSGFTFGISREFRWFDYGAIK